MLADAILEIAAEMQEWCEEGKGEYNQDLRAIQSWIKQLRRAVKAAEGSSSQQTTPLSAAMQHFSEIEKAKQEFRNKGKAKELQEETEGQMVFMVGGSQHGDSFPLVGNVPINAFVPVNGEVYQYTDGKLVYSEEATERLKQSRGG